MVKKGRTNTKRTKKTKEKENENEEHNNATVASSVVANTTANSSARRCMGEGPMYTILANAQLNETFHKRYTKELQQLYSKIDHEDFMFTFIKIFKTVLEADEGNEYGNTALAFCAKFVTSFESEKTHPILAETFNWLLSTISNLPRIRYRICFSVNLILKHLGPYAALDDTQCNQIMYYMMDRLKDVSASVRKEAVLAMQRLQVPDNPKDPVLISYQYHLCSDPSASVRQCIITCMGRNYLTMPHLLERLWDVDEKVRRHTYINLVNYPVRSYKVSQRLTLIERGLNDSSEMVKKKVINFLLKSWIEAYQNNYIQLTAALKLDSNEEELLRYKRVVRQMLFVIFKQQDNCELLAQLPLAEDCDLHRCLPLEDLTLELVVYWQCLSGYLQQTQADEFEQVLPELSVFCDYVKKFCDFQQPDIDKFAHIEFQSILLSLVEILESYDLGDEIGRENLKDLITHLLKECRLDHKIVAVLVRCVEQLISDVDARTQYFIDIIYEICELNAKQKDLVHDRELTDKLLDNVDTSLVMKIRSLKVKILELEELEENFVRQKEYMRAQAVNNERMVVREQYTDLIQPLLEKHGELELPTRPKLSKQERVLKGLYISFYMVASEHVHNLNLSLCKLYKDFICRHLASTELDIFEWAIKCGTTFSILYEAYTKEVFDVLILEFYRNNNEQLCEVASQCICELMDHYGVDFFMDVNQSEAGQNQAPKSKRRMLFTMQNFDGEDDRSQTLGIDQNMDIITMMGFAVERADKNGILLAIVRGLCRLVLRGQLDNRTDVIEKLLMRYFNPNTDAKVSQVLGMFFENIIAQKQQHLMQPCLLPIVWSVMNGTYVDGMPEHVTRFFIDLTVQDHTTPENNLHNRIAISFLNYIHNYYTERKDMCRLLAKELITLRVNVLNCPQIKDEMSEIADKLIDSELEPRMVKNITDFKDLLNGKFNPPANKPDGNDSDADAEECESVAATIASASECQATVTTDTAAAASVTSKNDAPLSTINEASVAPSEEAEATVAPVAPTPATIEPVLTTFGVNNHVGIRYLRRSLYNSISHSDAESVCGPQSPAPVPVPDADTVEQQEINVTIRRAKSKQQPENPKTPEKRPAEHISPATISKTVSETETDADAEADAEEIVNEDRSPITQSTHDDSEVIVDSPTVASPMEASKTQNTSRLRMRSMRKLNATAKGSRTSPVGKSKRKVLHLEIQTPLRNGRKRLLRRKSKDAVSAQASNSSDSSVRITPLTKQRRLDAKSPKEPNRVTVTVTVTAAPSKDSEKVTGSPTSSTSSIKENTAPEAAATALLSTTIHHKTPATSRRPVRSSVTSTPVSRVTTRNSARRQRMSAMVMTRKRMSLELSMTEGHPRMSTPKRVRQDKAGNTSGSRTPKTQTRTRAGAVEVEAETNRTSTRTRR